jgi:hypothetical protein
LTDIDQPAQVATEAPGGEELIGKVAQAWADVLDLDDASTIPLDVNFLETGGSSLLLIMLWEELSGLTSRNLKVSHLFQHSTVRAQAAFLAGSDTVAERPLSVLGARDRGQLLGRARRDQATPTHELGK